MDKAGINRVKIRLDPENKTIRLKNGLELEIDTSYQPEKHLVLTGTVEGLPMQLIYSEDGSKMPWETTQELRIGDEVVCYYLGVMNCLAPERRQYTIENGELYVYLRYELIYARVRDNVIQPINGYILAEPADDPEWVRRVRDAEIKGFILPDLRKPNKTHVVYGKVAYVGVPNKRYFNQNQSDKDVNVDVGDVVAMKRVRDIPVEYEYHAKLDGGKKYYRLQRHDILAVL